MTIKEKYEKYTNEELAEAIGNLERKLDYLNDCIMQTKSTEIKAFGERETTDVGDALLELRCAYDARMK